MLFGGAKKPRNGQCYFTVKFLATVIASEKAVGTIELQCIALPCFKDKTTLDTHTKMFAYKKVLHTLDNISIMQYKIYLPVLASSKFEYSLFFSLQYKSCSFSRHAKISAHFFLFSKKCFLMTPSLLLSNKKRFKTRLQ